MRLLVLGGGAAGMTAASLVMRRAPDTEIVVVERGSHTSYSMCGIPYYVGGEIETSEDLVVRTPEEFQQQGMTVHMGTEAIAIDPQARTVTVRVLATGEEREERYDELLYALGAHPSVPDLPGLAEHGYVVHTLDEGERLRTALDRRDDVKSVVVVGAGYIGMELAEALVERGLRTTLVDMAEQVMGTLDPDMAAHVQGALEDFGVRLGLGERLERIDADDAGCRSVQTDRDCYEADLVVLAMGAKPNVELAAAAGCRVGETGALAVDRGLRTNVEHVWAAGDCVESTHLVSGQQVNVQLGTHANKQAKIAAINLTGGDTVFPGVVGTAVTKVCQWEIARTGLSEREAEAAGLDGVTASFTGTASAGYMPDPGTVHVKMMAERGTGRVLGAQLVGTGNVGKRIDTAATWCQLGVRVADAQLFDLSYAPPFGGVWDLLAVAARKLVSALDLEPRL
ncbi:MAG: FAD-dependent oxidoreductase [Egibacteraceae bacterium]